MNDNQCKLTNIPQWEVQDGNKLASLLKMKKFVFINDFTAASYGASVLGHKDFTILGQTGEAQAQEGGHSVKVVIGPGTGLGVGILVKHEEAEHYQPVASEGGHVDFVVQTEEDYKLLCFAKEFIKTSDNVENLRAKGEIKRVSVERLCAGPAVPLLYAFMKQQHPDLKSVLEETKPFNDITSKDIIMLGINS